MHRETSEFVGKQEKTSFALKVGGAAPEHAAPCARGLLPPQKPLKLRLQLAGLGAPPPSRGHTPCPSSESSSGGFSEHMGFSWQGSPRTTLALGAFALRHAVFWGGLEACTQGFPCSPSSKWDRKGPATAEDAPQTGVDWSEVQEWPPQATRSDPAAAFAPLHGLASPAAADRPGVRVFPPALCLSELLQRPEMVRVAS